MGKPKDPEVTAEILIDAALLGDKKAAAKNGVTLRTIQRYRKDFLENHEMLSRAVAYRIVEIKRLAWTLGLHERLKESIDKAKEAIDAGIKKDPVGTLEGINENIAILADIDNTTRMLYGRSQEAQNLQTGNGDSAGDGPLDAEDESKK